MKSPPDQNVDDYIQGFPADVRQILGALRNAIRRVVPDAEESISYRIPTYKLANRPLVYFAAYQHHISLYPATERSVIPGLAPYRSGRGTLKFPIEKPIPFALVMQFVRLRVKEELARGSKRAADSHMTRSRTAKGAAAAKRG
jgi:uncharacterized protein YdhG (YjbR/CyaY superfamily)